MDTMKNHTKHGNRKLRPRLQARTSPAPNEVWTRNVDVEEDPVSARDETPIRAVVVNDNAELIAKISRYLLVHTRVDVAGVALDGVEALETVGRLRPQLVVMYLQMPGMNGLDATEQLRRMFPAIGIIMTSADDGLEIAGLCQEYGADAFVSKRRLQRDLFPAIQQVLRKQPRSKILHP